MGAGFGPSAAISTPRGDSVPVAFSESVFTSSAAAGAGPSLWLSAGGGVVHALADSAITKSARFMEVLREDIPGIVEE